MSGNIQITGIPTTPGPEGSVPLRLELRDLQKSQPDQFNLFLLGLKAFQGLDENDVTSYYQIAGIHGMPFKAWDNVKGISDWDFGGYCTHSSVLFAPWHRPYLALFEQSIYALVVGIAEKFPTAIRERYVTAAKTFRMPYYDWAAKPSSTSPAFPTALSSAKISIVDIDGKTKEIDNPLYQFSFHPVNPSPDDFDEQWSQYPTTVRYPDRNGKSQDARVTRVLANESASLRSNVSLILLSYKDFDAFSNNEWRGSGQPVGTFGSLEDVHGEIHDKTGGSGHMSALETSAFDPLFWLHHSNVDRLWAIWQDLNPDSFIEPRPAPYSTFTTEEGTSETENSSLVPFWDASGTKFWTSVQVKDSRIFGYAYPETQKWKYADTATYQAALRQSVTKLYGGNVFRNFVQTIAPPKPAAAGADHPVHSLAASAKDKAEPVIQVAAVDDQKPVVHDIHPSETDETGAKSDKEESADDSLEEDAEGAEPIPSALAHLAPDNTYTEWIVSVRAIKHGLGQTYRVIVFLGDISPNPADWDLEFNTVGRVTILGRSPSTRCAKCQRDRDASLTVTGTVPLTSALLQDIAAHRLSSLEPAEVVPYLRANLKWKVTLFNGDEQPLDEVPGLKVSVVSTKVKIGEDGIPIYSGEYVTHSEITDGMTAGLQNGEEVA